MASDRYEKQHKTVPDLKVKKADMIANAPAAIGQQQMEVDRGAGRTDREMSQRITYIPGRLIETHASKGAVPMDVDQTGDSRWRGGVWSYAA